MKPEVHHLPPAKTWRERLHRNRFGLARHLVQVLVLLAFVGTARWGWTIAGEKLLSGDLSSSLVLGTIPLSDPLALLERLFAGHLPQGAALLGAVIVFVLYAVLGSRTFCGWVCPMNLVTDLADALRRALKLDADLVRLSKGVRYASLVTALLASAVTGVAAFEAVSPQAFLWRDVVWGTGLGALSAALGIFALDLALFVILDLGDHLGGHADLGNQIVQVAVFHGRFQIGRDLVLIPRVRVDDIPLCFLSHLHPSALSGSRGQTFMTRPSRARKMESRPEMSNAS